MPIEAAYSYTDSIERTRVKLSRSVGYNACDISAFLAGVSWSVLATLQLVRKKKYWIIILGMAGIAILGQVLSGGRAGFVAWVGTGLTLCLLKWRKYLVLAPVVAILVPIIFPGVVQRMKLGFGQIDVAGQVTIDEQALLSGRAQVWPHVIDKIRESPLIGYGRLAMRRTGLSREVSIQEGQTAFAHPHNMYLEILLDNGILGSIPIFVFWGMVLTYSTRLFRSTNHLCSAVGGLCLSLMLAQLIAGIGSQHFYPKESTMGMWIAIFLSIRVYVEKTRAHIYPVAAESSVDAQRSQQQALVASACANGTIAQ